MLLERFKEMGDPAPTITEFTPHTVNGYTYYWIETFYKTADSIGDPDILYVQIGDNMYLEIYNIWFTPRFEDVVNDTIYIKEVR